MKYLLLIFLFSFCAVNRAYTQDLKVVEQNYAEAISLAATEGKLLFIDFYTTWCQPCKKLDKLIFQNDSIRQELGKDFVLLKYDAENDTIFHLSKKHHINSYPTGLILNPEGRVLLRKYGFAGEEFESISQGVAKFTDEALALHRDNRILSGYASTIDISRYPKFYIDYVNRTITKVDSADFAAYWAQEHDIFSEEYVSTLMYFAGDAIPDQVSASYLEHKDKYAELFGEADTSVSLMFMAYGKFESAIDARNKAQLQKANAWARQALDKDFAEMIIARSAEEFEKAGKQ